MRALSVASVADRVLGPPIPTSRRHHEHIGVLMGTAVFSSDPISSNAYATEAIMRALMLASVGGAYALGLTFGVALGIAVLIGLVVLCYVQTIRHYPNGGGGFMVALDNMGPVAALITATALLFDYILTVAVSVAAGVKAIMSTLPPEHWFRHWNVPLGVVIIGLITIANLRGLKESGRLFMLPTYSFVLAGFYVVGTAIVRTFHLFGTAPLVFPAQHPVSLPNFSAFAIVWLIAHAFASGCTALTGIEAISNGVEAFKAPAAKRAISAMFLMGGMALVLFVGISYYAPKLGLVPNDSESILSQLGRTLIGTGPVYYWLQVSTTLILILAANTAFQDFPRLSFFMAREGYLPRKFMNIGRKLVYSYGIIVLMALSSFIFILFQGDEQHLLPLYALGVFITFTISQFSMTRMWNKVAGIEPGTELVTLKTVLHYDPQWRLWKRLNIFGGIMTFLVFLVLFFTKFQDGGYAIMFAMVVVVPACMGIKRHYIKVAKKLSMNGDAPQVIVNQPANCELVIMVPVGDVQRATINTLLKSSFRGHVIGVYVEVNEDDTPRFMERWDKFVGPQIPLVAVSNDYRDVPGEFTAQVLAMLPNLIQGQKLSVAITRLATHSPFTYFIFKLLHNNGAQQIEREVTNLGLTTTVEPYLV